MIENEAERPPLVRITESSSTATGRQYLKWLLQAEASSLLPNHKVTMCCKMIRAGKNDVPILYNQRSQHARFGNLCTCAKLWVCPVCASRITEKRADGIGRGIRISKVNPVLITFTMQHHIGISLRSSLGALVAAYAGLTSGRAWAGFMYRSGWITAIRALEITYGSNGWHPHLHILALMEHQQHADDIALMEMWLTDMWQKHLSAKGAYADKAHGVDIRAAFGDVAEYVAKFGRQPNQGWTIERELTKAPTKVARAGGFTPFALLEASAAGTAWAGERFIEYAAAMHNKAQLYIPPNARELLRLDDETDEQIAEGEQTLDEVDTILARVTREQWSIVLKRDMRRDLLDVAHVGDSEYLIRWIETNVVQSIDS